MKEYTVYKGIPGMIQGRIQGRGQATLKVNWDRFRVWGFGSGARVWGLGFTGDRV